MNDTYRIINTKEEHRDIRFCCLIVVENCSLQPSYFVFPDKGSTADSAYSTLLT